MEGVGEFLGLIIIVVTVLWVAMPIVLVVMNDKLGRLLFEAKRRNDLLEKQIEMMGRQNKQSGDDTDRVNQMRRRI